MRCAKKILENCLFEGYGISTYFSQEFHSCPWGSIPRLVGVSALLIVLVRFFAQHFHSVLHSISTALNH